MYLGTSQYTWRNIEFVNNFYYSKDTQGTFSVAFDKSIYDEVLKTEKILNVPIDTKLCEIQKKYYKKCFTFYPNLTIADVSYSDIRDTRDINTHSKNIRWDLSLYDITKIKILLLADTPNWAFDNIAHAIVDYNPYHCLQYEIHYTHTEDYIKKSLNYDDWDYVYLFFEGRTDMPQNNKKLIRGCYSALWLESNKLTPQILGKNLVNSRAIIYVNHKLKSELSKYCPHIKSCVISDAASPHVFYPTDEPKNKKFTVLFVGNIDRKIKRFDKIKKICKAAGVNLEVATKTPHKELYKSYNKADLSINFSISEGGPQNAI